MGLIVGHAGGVLGSFVVIGAQRSALSRARHDRVPHLDSVALECGFNGSESIVNVEHALFTMKKGRTSA